MKFVKYLCIAIAFVVSCLTFYVVLLVMIATIPGQSFSISDQVFFCCGLLYPVILVVVYLAVVIRLIKKQKVGILPILPIIYFFTYLILLIIMAE